MIVHKFGGASVKSAETVKNLSEIVKDFSGNIIIVISAMDKITNNLEELTQFYFDKNNNECYKVFLRIKNFHIEIINDLFIKKETILDKINLLFNKIEEKINSKPSEDYDYEYDQIVPFGELLSTKIISAYLNCMGISNLWTDIRKILITDNIYRDATIDFRLTENLFKEKFHFNNTSIYITQGFIGASENGKNTTLGREGSDYSASVLAYISNAEKVIIWKNVKGILTADPELYNESIKLDEISYEEAIELSYFGAKIIHPKTIKPLQNKKIPLFVKSFLKPEENGTVIKSILEPINLPPVIILKKQQVLVSISPVDFSFIVEENISKIFAVFAKFKIKANLTQNSAISFSACVDYVPDKFEKIVKILKKDFKVLYNMNVELITIRHYNEESVNKFVGNKKILVEQKSRHTARFVVE